MQAKASEHDSATIMRPQSRTRFVGKFGWIALGFVLGAGFWHAVGFWSFVTAVTLTGNAPDRGNLTSMVLKSPKANDIVAPSPVRADQSRPTAAPTTAAAALTHGGQPASTVAVPAIATSLPTEPTPESNTPSLPTIVAAPASEPRLTTAPQPTDAPRTAELEPASQQPETVSTRPRRKQETPAWAAKIITGTFDR